MRLISPRHEASFDEASAKRPTTETSLSLLRVISGSLCTDSKWASAQIQRVTEGGNSFLTAHQHNIGHKLLKAQAYSYEKMVGKIQTID